MHYKLQLASVLPTVVSLVCRPQKQPRQSLQKES